VLDIAEAFRANARARIAAHPNHLHTLNTLRNMTSASAPILLHAVGQAVVHRVGLGVEVGDYIVSTKVSHDVSDNGNGKDGLVCCEVYSVEDTARARQATLRALGPTDEIPDPTGLHGFKHNDKFKKCKRKQLVVVLGKEKANDFFGTASAGEGTVDPLIGKKVVMQRMIDFGDGNALFQDGIVIDGVSGNGKYKMIATKNGAVYEFTEDKALVRALYAAARRASTPPIDLSTVAPWTYNLGVGSAHLYSLVRTLEASKGLTAGRVCAIELLDVLEGVAPGSTQGHDLDRSLGGVPVVSTITDATLTLACARIKLQMESEAVKKESYPCGDGTRLGKAIRRVLNGELGVNPQPFRLVGMLASHAVSPGEFQTFLEASYILTLQRDRWPIVQTAAGGDYFLRTRLEVACKDGVGADADAIAALEYDMTAPAFMSWLTDVTSTPKSGVASSSHGAALSVTGHHTPKGAFGSRSINVVVHPELAKRSEAERKVDEQLQEDAEGLSKEQVSMALIESMKAVKASGDREALAKLMDQIKDARVLRLLNATSDLRTAMQGGFTNIYRAFDSVRSVLDRRLEVMVLGADISPRSKTSAAFRALRTGNVHRLRWLNLVELADDGTMDKPLLSLQRMERGGAKYAMATALARASTIVSLSFPALLAVAALFFPKLLAKLCEYMDLGVAWPALNEWFAAIVQLMSRPKRRLDDGASSTSTISMDVDWFDTPSDFNRKVERAVQFAIAGGYKRGRTHGTGRGEHKRGRRCNGAGPSTAGALADSSEEEDGESASDGEFPSGENSSSGEDSYGEESADGESYDEDGESAGEEEDSEEEDGEDGEEEDGEEEDGEDGEEEDGEEEEE
jgi:hypothetical protein